MKRFTFMLLAAFIAVMAFAAAPSAKAVRIGAPKAQTGKLLQQAGKVDAPRSVPMGKFKAPMKAAEDYVIITEQPAGELKTYKRDGSCYYVQNQTLYYEAQSGAIDIVWGADNKVYFKDIVSGLEYGTWVEGTLSSDGSTITVPLGQNLIYNANYDACVALRLINYVSGSGFSVDTEATSVTFTVDDGVLSLQGTGFTTVSLGGVWTDDGTIQNYGDYESVYTEYVEDLTIVTPPASALAMSFDAPMQCKTINGDEVSTTVKMAFDLANNQVYIQGLVPMMPEAWAQGEADLETGEVIFPVQFLGYNDEDKVFMGGYDGNLAPFTLTIGGIEFPTSATELMQKYVAGTLDFKVITASSSDFLIANDNELSFTYNPASWYEIYQGVFIGTTPETLVLPEGLDVVTVPFKGTYYDGNDSSDFDTTVNIAIDGQDIYVQGLCLDLPEAWVQGTVDENRNVVIPTGQYVGLSDYGLAYLVGAPEEGSEEEVADIVATFDETKGVNVLQNNMFYSLKQDDIYYIGAVLAGATIGQGKTIVNADVTFDFNAMDEPCSTSTDHSGDIPAEGRLFEADGVTLFVSASTANTANRFWSTDAGPQLRMYGGTMTFTAPEGATITSIKFNYGKWATNTADTGSFSNDENNKVATWSPDSEVQEVVVTVAGNTQLNSIVVTIATAGDEPQPIEPAVGELFSFDDGKLGYWTTIDADGDGYTWTIGQSPQINTHGDDQYCVYSESYSSTAGALTPDNYLVSPKMKLDGKISFYACAQDREWPAEHFGVAVSTAGNTDAADFQMVQDWTMTAAREYQPTNARGTFRGPKKAPGNWYLYTVDLSQFEGAEGYVAIRHFDCTDYFYLVVDDITLETSQIILPDYVITPEPGTVKSLNDFEITFNNYTVALAEAEAAQAELYKDDNFDEPFATAAISLVNDHQIAFSFDDIKEAGEYTLLIPDGTLAIATGGVLGDLEFGIYTIDAKPEVVELPEGLEPETWYLTAKAYSGLVKNQEVAVAIDGNDIYVQGINAEYLPEAWVKGTIDAEAGTATFPTGQYFGAFEYDGEEYDMFFVGYDNDLGEVSDVVFTFDAENGVLTTDTWVVVSALQDKVSYYEYYQGMDITREPAEVPELVELPEGVEPEEWTLEGFWGDGQDGFDVQRAVGVAFDGTDVYVQGLAYYFEESWLKGTIDAETGIVTFPSGQLVGEDEYGEEYMVGFDEDFCDIQYVYDAEAKTLTQVTPYVLESQTETGLDDEGEFAFWGFWEVSYFYAGEPVAIEPVEVPENLETETYLFTAMEFVEQDEDLDRARVLKAEGETETATFDFNALVGPEGEPWPVSSGTGDNYDPAGEITEPLVLTEDNVTLTISPAEEGATATRFWKTNNGPQLRVYNGTLTFEVPEGYEMTQIEFNTAKWNENNTADSGEFNGATWTGKAQNVVVTIGTYNEETGKLVSGNSQINSINVTVAETGEEPTPIDPEDPTLEPYTSQIQVGFDGNDVYFSGINDNTADMWMKGTLSEDGTTVTIPANQYMGFIASMFSTYDFYMTAVNEEGEFTDLVLNFDAENNKFTTDQTVMLNGSRFVYYPYQTFTDVEITKMPEFAATPADPSIEDYKLAEVSYPYVIFNIPTEDVDGNAIVAAKLFYTVWIQKGNEVAPFVVTADAYRDVEVDMTEVPYNYDDSYDIYKGGSRFYINTTDDIATWEKIGIQSIYYGGGECNESNIVWMENPVYDPTTTGISTVKADNLQNAVIYNLAGQRLQTVQKGLNIINGRKVMVK